MVKTEIFCDRCGEEVKQSRTKLAVAAGPLLASREHVDLCYGCQVEFAKWLASTQQTVVK